MAELSLKENLQPALLDRLVDDERIVTTHRVRVDTARLALLGLSLSELEDILLAQGLHAPAGNRKTDELEFVAYGLGLGPAQLRTIRITPPGAPDGVRLQEFCEFDSRATTNTETEAGVRSTTSLRRLRESVQRDLGWLFNAMNLDSAVDLEPYPEVRDSVLNYGLPSFAGRTASTIDARDAASQIARAIEFFEPRLSRVRVSSEKPDDADEESIFRFRIEAELWGRPASQHLTLLTRIDVFSGDVTVQDAERK